MKDRFVLIMTALAIAALFGVIYKLRKQGASAKEIKLIRQAVEKNLAETQAIDHNVRRQRGAINQMHRYLVPLQKG
jgi:hypothetical protein